MSSKLVWVMGCKSSNWTKINISMDYGESHLEWSYSRERFGEIHL